MQSRIFLTKNRIFLTFSPFSGVFLGSNVKIRGMCGKRHALSCFTRCDIVKNSAASNFYEMRRNLNFMARSFRRDADSFFRANICGAKRQGVANSSYLYIPKRRGLAQGNIGLKIKLTENEIRNNWNRSHWRLLWRFAGKGRTRRALSAA